MTPKRTLRIAAGVAAATLLVAFAAWMIGASTIDLRVDRASGERALTVEADLPAATCRKVLVADFPWVRFECDPRPADEGAPDAGPASTR